MRWQVREADVARDMSRLLPWQAREDGNGSWMARRLPAEARAGACAGVWP
ncbi:hypothetical protein A2U01_0060534 [Trifolium medium]|uniref:Uncharacterized protein n=1 Tax=Trifolium medium TaxID=97028 RepID=A0A392RRQ9_9FABA|nr:hypothetical protein [Trifolium medium]